MGDGKVQSYLIFGFWVLYVVLLVIFWNKIIEYANKSNFLIGFVLYYLTNPAYLMLIYGVVRFTAVNKIRSSIASILLVFALDVVSSPRILLQELSGCVSMSLDTGTLFVNWFAVTMKLSPKFGYYVFYVVIPIVFFWISMELLGYTKFLSRIESGDIGGE